MRLPLRSPGLSALLLLGAALTPLLSSPAHARNGGLYFELAPSWGFYSTDEVIIEEGDDSFGNFPVASFVPALKLGVNLFGWAGAEAHLTGHYWDLEGDPGGAGYVGGVFRVTPLEILTHLLPDTVELPSLFPPGPVKWRDRPFDLGVSFGGGYSLIGEDYAYQGGYFQWGFDIKWFITPNFAVGLDFPFRHMLYAPFRISNFNKREGYCTDGEKAFVPVGNTRVNVPDNAGELGPAISTSQADDLCDGAVAPAALFIAPALTITGVFDFGV
jgi:hypothetical protein